MLGRVRAWCGGRELDLGSPQQRVVLAVLLLRRGRPVSVGELVDAVWGEEPPAAAVSVLRTYVSRLRKVLRSGPGGSGGSGQVLVSVADGYLARVPDGAVDVGVFERRVTEGRRLRGAGELSGAAEALRGALGVWEGVPLAGLSGSFVEVERDRLGEVRLGAWEVCAECEVELGRHGEVVAGLVGLLGEHPLREGLCRLLMLALYRSGRQAEALEAYRGMRARLVGELGVEPGVALRELHERILAADPALDLPHQERPAMPGAPAPGSAPGPVPGSAAGPVPDSVPGSPAGSAPGSAAGAVPGSVPGTGPEAAQDSVPGAVPGPVADSTAVRQVARPAQLPADLPAFTGREDELRQVQALMPDAGAPSSIMVIGGMGGIGKTALAVHWAHRIAHLYPDGQLYINLRGFDPTGETVPQAEAVRIFLDALGVPPEGIPDTLEAQSALFRSLLARRRMLLVLDNARDTEQVRPLLPGSADCLVIVTSRSQLTGLIANEGAQPVALSPLTPQEAYGFLERRIGAAWTRAEPWVTDEIIECCGRLPLALAVVAARAATNPTFSLDTVAGELRESRGNLDALTGGDPTTDVRTVFSWSYEALSAPASRLFRLLGLHSGPDISAHAAAALAGVAPREARTLLAEITRAHLVDEHAPGRYALHDLLRVYAAERVGTEEPPEERERAVERLLLWYLHTADATYPHLAPRRRRVPLDSFPSGQEILEFTSRGEALQWCENERPNLVAAVHLAAGTGRHGIAWRQTAVLWGFFYLRSHLHDWLSTARASLAGARETGDLVGEAWSHGDVAAALTMMRRFDEAIEHLREAMALCEQLGDVWGRSQAVGNLGNAYLQAGQLEKAVESFERVMRIDRALDDSWSMGIGLSNLGDALQRLGRFDEALDHLRHGLKILSATGNRWVEGVTLDILGAVQHKRHHHHDAIEHYHEALRAHRDVGNRWGEGDTLGHLGDALLAAGKPNEARVRWTEALAIFEESDHPDTEKIRANLRRLEACTPGGRARRPRNGAIRPSRSEAGR
ncbi:AfsR/SARP family transcriptional regulator [Streptomyces albiaxialis]|uniref:AfsR/SARP family transcriptional regulator n=1 Tax=Streptomyces albiaxialis TaxID=329523 RepID=UPI0031E35933